jgi:nitroimidazol reductase NimA-like FMN-containing flavoprotein (pyridoxamine 5'-phosphate oxidase superfamily)
MPHEYTTYFRSVIVFGKARILGNEGEKRSVLEKLTAKYSPDHYQDRLREFDKQPRQVCLVELAIEHITGKEHIEFIRAKHLQDS